LPRATMLCANAVRRSSAPHTRRNELCVARPQANVRQNARSYARVERVSLRQTAHVTKPGLSLTMNLPAAVAVTVTFSAANQRNTELVRGGKCARQRPPARHLFVLPATTRQRMLCMCACGKRVQVWVWGVWWVCVCVWRVCGNVYICTSAVFFARVFAHPAPTLQKTFILPCLSFILRPVRHHGC